MKEFSDRTIKVIGEDNFAKLSKANIAVFGIGGVGGSTAEALARAGIGKMTLIDGDTVAPSNLNRQAVAFLSTIGKSKAEVMKSIILDINPDAKITALTMFFGESTKNEIDLSAYDYIIDAIDDIPAKLLLISMAKACGTRVISSMGAGNKLGTHPFEVADIYKTSVCPLARIMRQRLKKMGIDSLKCVYSKEPPIVSPGPPGSVSFVPPMAGLVIAGEVVRELIKNPS